MKLSGRLHGITRTRLQEAMRGCGRDPIASTVRMCVTWKRRHGPRWSAVAIAIPLIISARYFANAATNPWAFAATVSALSPGR